MAKGISFEEKRKRLLDCFHVTKSVYNLKEVEKMGSKKGIVLNTVKDVLQSILDDGLVDTEKKIKLLEELKKKNSDLEVKIMNANNSIQELESKKDHSSEREELNKKIKKLESELVELNKEYELYKQNDPEVIKKKEQFTKIAYDSANRWTDNIFSIQSWIKQRFNMDETSVNKYFSISEDLDYLEAIK